MSPIRPYVRLNRMLAVDRREITHIYLYALVSGLINLTLPLGIQAIINLIMGGQLASSWGCSSCSSPLAWRSPVRSR
jgi:hypothetical protein